MVLKFFAVPLLGLIVLLYLGRFFCIVSGGRLFGAWSLLSRPPGRVELIFCYVALLLLLLEGIVLQLHKAGAL